MSHNRHKTMQITKADIAAYADFTVNIADAKVNFQIKDAGLMDVAPVIGRDLYNKVLALEPVPVPVEGEPEPEPESEEVTKLRGLYSALVPYWALSAYKRLFAVHGVDVTQAGATTPRGQDFEQITPQRRGEILNLIRSKVNFYQNELEAYMKENHLLPETNACTDTRKRGSYGITVAKRR